MVGVKYMGITEDVTHNTAHTKLAKANNVCYEASTTSIPRIPYLYNNHVTELDKTMVILCQLVVTIPCALARSLLLEMQPKK